MKHNILLLSFIYSKSIGIQVKNVSSDSLLPLLNGFLSQEMETQTSDCQSNNLRVILHFSLSSSQRISTQQVFSTPPTNKPQSFAPLHLHPHPLTQGHHHISHQANTVAAPTLHPKFCPQPLPASGESDLLNPQIRSHQSSVWNSFRPSPGSQRGLQPQLHLLHSTLHPSQPLPGRPCPYFSDLAVAFDCSAPLTHCYLTISSSWHLMLLIHYKISKLYFFWSSVRFIRNWAESRALILPPPPPPSTTSLITNI